MPQHMRAQGAFLHTKALLEPRPLDALPDLLSRTQGANGVVDRAISDAERGTHLRGSLASPQPRETPLCLARCPGVVGPGHYQS